MEKSPKSTLKYTEDGEKSMEKSGEKWRKVEKMEKYQIRVEKYYHRDQSKWDEDGFKIQYVRMLCTFSLLLFSSKVTDP